MHVWNRRMFNGDSYRHAIILKCVRLKFPALSRRMVLIGLSGNCALNLMICAKSLANATLRVESKQTCDHLVDASIKTMKYLNGPQ
ncbi:hypothetical protein Syun_011405 [Stephania yunnanensis]|uniref:Uncharacterized protein n=4 Tax=Stephania TaxID=147243 RepID=A0AAP0JZQ1_9MAGN